MATRCLSIGGSSFLPIRLRRRLNAVRAAARLKQQSFLFNIDLKSGSGLDLRARCLHRSLGAERTFAAYVAGCEPVARVMLELHEVR